MDTQLRKMESRCQRGGPLVRWNGWQAWSLTKGDVWKQVIWECCGMVVFASSVVFAQAETPGIDQRQANPGNGVSIKALRTAS